MAKNRRNHGRRPQQRRPSHRPAHTSAEDQAVFQALRRSLRSEGPFELFVAVGGMLEITDPRRRNPFMREDSGPSLADLVDSFIGTPYAETTAALTVIRALTTDGRGLSS